MMERLKSWLLILLIATSLLQSYFLAYSKPRLDPIIETQYIETQLLGEQREMNQMVFPQYIILHDKSGQHSVLYPKSYFFDLIFDKVKQRSFSGFRETTRPMSGLDEMRHKNDGIEIVFKNGIPVSLLTTMLDVEDSIFYEADFIDRIWLTKLENSEELNAFFYSKTSLNVYESTRIDLTSRDLEQFIGFGALMSNYMVVDNFYYVPEEPYPMVKYRLAYDRYTVDQLQNSLFVDPSISQKILDRDGTEIITDGKRGIIVDNEYDWISYSDYVPTTEMGNDVKENLAAATQFINRHGGWNGDHLVSFVPTSRTQSFVFYQQYDSYPIVASRYHPFGYIKIMLQKGVVSNYERSLITLDFDGAMKEQAMLPGGEELAARVRHFARRHAISSITPAYHPVITDDYIELEPRWAVELTDGTLQLLPFLP